MGLHLSDAGYVTVVSDARRLVCSRRHLPAWVWPAIVFLFPFGFLGLLARRTEVVTLELHPDASGGTRLLAYGEGPASVRRAVERIAP